ncbi:zinc finger protein ZAT11-like [Vicia villosa]|uniref:zinc finger protein ZAT11-like n=1 Tax=Vicia villosa TaxID=3911 RepID=UPI00273C3000|nr:zinc finger protein ZAT11-like [Vicia villosa]
MKRVRNNETSEVDMAGAFKCKTCSKEFLSFQALGGHRASHNKLKLNGRNQKKVHVCSICGLQFATGQALGGHMRKHRTGTGPVHDYDQDETMANSPKRFHLFLDLNLTPYENDLKLLNFFFFEALSTFT